MIKTEKNQKKVSLSVELVKVVVLWFLNEVVSNCILFHAFGKEACRMTPI